MPDIHSHISINYSRPPPSMNYFFDFFKKKNKLIHLLLNIYKVLIIFFVDSSKYTIRRTSTYSTNTNITIYVEC